MMKKLLLAAMAMLFAMNVTAQNTQAIRQEITNSFRNGMPEDSRETKAMYEEWWKHPELGEPTWGLDSGCEFNRCSVVSISNITSNSADVVVKIYATCDGEQDISQEKEHLIKENGKWVIDETQFLLEIFREHGIKWNSGQSANTRVLTDLISFKDIINTNGDFSSLVRTHGFKEFEFQEEGMRFPMTYYYKNCVVRNNEIVPYGNGTSVRITVNGTMSSTQYKIEVFNSTAYNQLINDFLQYAKKKNDGYDFYWSDGHISKFALFEENSNKKGGYILITVPFYPYEEQ